MEEEKACQTRKSRQITTPSAGGQKRAAAARRAWKEPATTSSLDPISWDDFFDKFDSAHLPFLYQDKTEGGAVSRFHKFVDRKTQEHSSGRHPLEGARLERSLHSRPHDDCIARHARAVSLSVYVCCPTLLCLPPNT